MHELAASLGDEEDAERYLALARAGARFLDDELFNGEYYEQKVEFRKLKDQSFVQLISSKRPSLPPSMLRILKKEGPKYQYGKGCLADGVIGAWMARLYGIPMPLDPEKVRTSILSIHRHNFRSSLREHCNPQRPGYAIGEEPGLLICSWPRGGKPTLPFPYSDEVMTGMEYQVASHLISEGFIREGMQIVKATRSRHDGSVRNPYNEYECGNYYARAMASFALLQAFSGFRYSKRDKVMEFAPRTNQRPFQSFFATADAHGTITLKENKLEIRVIEGELAVHQIKLTTGPGSESTIWKVDATIRPQRPFVLAWPRAKSARRRGR